MKRFLIASVLALALLLAPLQASALQGVVTSIDPDTESGSQLAIDLNASFSSLISTNRGNARPAYATAGTIWIDVVSGTHEIAYVYDGNSDIELFSYNPSTHSVSYALASGAPTGSLLYKSASGWSSIAPGSSGQVLTTQGDGAAPAWGNGTSIANVQTFYYPGGTWNKPSGYAVDAITVISCWGGGGGGAGNYGGGGGGSGGNYSTYIARLSELPSSVAVTVGAGGAGGSNANGGSGGTSTFGGFVVAAGGLGGLKVASVGREPNPNFYTAQGGAGGIYSPATAGISTQISGAGGGGGGIAGHPGTYGGTSYMGGNGGTGDNGAPPTAGATPGGGGGGGGASYPAGAAGGNGQCNIRIWQ